MGAGCSKSGHCWHALEGYWEESGPGWKCCLCYTVIPDEEEPDEWEGIVETSENAKPKTMLELYQVNKIEK